MTKLNQIIAVLNGNTGRKTVCQKAVTAVYQTLQKAAAFTGIARSYRPLTDDGEKFPPENKPVTAKVPDLLNQARDAWTVLFDTVATQDTANTIARADVLVDDAAVLKGVPVTTLMFLEKQLTDIHTSLQAVPVLADEHEWKWSEAAACWVTAPTEAAKIKKVEIWLHAEDATEKHPAQGKWSTNDIITGYWTTTLQSGAMPKQRKIELLARILKLLDGVRKAREQANEMTITDVHVGDSIFDYVLNGNTPSAK